MSGTKSAREAFGKDLAGNIEHAVARLGTKAMLDKVLDDIGSVPESAREEARAGWLKTLKDILWAADISDARRKEEWAAISAAIGRPNKRRSISNSRRFEIFKRDGFACQYCGATPPKAVLHVDHIVPVAKGGGNSDGNLTTACSICNGGKAARSLHVVPTSLADRAAIVAEKEAQLAGYAAVMEAQRVRVENDCWTVVRALYGDVDTIDRKVFQSIKIFVNRMVLHKILEAVEIARAKHYSVNFPYFCGVCWKMIKEPDA